MIETALQEREERVAPPHTPHLSYSRINRYLHCPEQYRLYYIENLRPRFPSASLVFGQILHQALAFFFRERGDAVAFFLKAWGDARHVSLTYGQRESWVKLRTKGQALLEKFLREERPRLKEVKASEKVFELSITGTNNGLIGGKTGTPMLVTATWNEPVLLKLQEVSSMTARKSRVAP